MFAMNIVVSVSLLGAVFFINEAESMTHSLMYFLTSSTDVPNFPEFVEVGYVNGLQITHYDSETKKVVPKQQWMEKITEEDPQYWETETQINLNNEQVYKADTETIKGRLNQTEGSHIYQTMFGCEWDDETNDINGYSQFGFDGEDFIAFDLKTETFVAPRPEAVPSKLKWERFGENDRQKNYITYECVEYLKKYVRNGQKELMKKVIPDVYFLQKSPSSPVTCFATGFYPDRALLFWTKDGDELYDGVDPGEILPNHDGTFQVSTDLDVSSIPPEDWGRYECMFQLSGVEDMPYKLHPDKILTNDEKNTGLIAGLAVAVLGAILVVVLGVFLHKRCKAKQLTPPPSEPGVDRPLTEVVPVATETQDDVEEALDPDAETH